VQQDGRRVAPGARGLGVGFAFGQVGHRHREVHDDVGAARVLGIRRGFERHGRGAAAEQDRARDEREGGAGAQGQGSESHRIQATV
jgi:hypothetical protein